MSAAEVEHKPDSWVSILVNGTVGIITVYTASVFICLEVIYIPFKVAIILGLAIGWYGALCGTILEATEKHNRQKLRSVYVHIFLLAIVVILDGQKKSYHLSLITLLLLCEYYARLKRMHLVTCILVVIVLGIFQWPFILAILNIPLLFVRYDRYSKLPNTPFPWENLQVNEKISRIVRYSMGIFAVLLYIILICS